MKRLLALLLIAVLVLSVASCKFSFGNGEDPNGEDPNGEDPNGEGPNGEDPNGEDPNGEDPNGEDPASTGPAVDGDFHIFGEYNDIFKAFKELKFDFHTESEDGDPTSYTYSHVFIGEEELEYTLEQEDYSEVCSKYTITIFEDGEDTVIEAWFNEDGVVVKAGSNGEYTTGDMAALASFGFAFHIIPFYAYNEAYGEVFTEEDGFGSAGWIVKEQSSSTQDFGTGSAPVERYVFSWSWIQDDLTYDWEVATIAGKHIFTKWKMDVNGSSTELQVTRVIPF